MAATYQDKENQIEEQKGIYKQTASTSSSVVEDTIKEQEEVTVLRLCATCVLISPHLVITSKFAHPRNFEYDDAFVIFSIYGSPLSSRRYPINTKSNISCPDGDLVMYQLQESPGIDFTSFPTLSRSILNNEDELFLVGYPAFMDSGCSSTTVKLDETKKKIFIDAMRYYPTKSLVWFNPYNCNTKEKQSIEQTFFENQVDLVRLNHPGLKQMMGTGGFGVFRIDSESDCVEWCGIVLLSDLFKTVRHLSCITVSKVKYTITDGFLPKRATIWLPIGSFAINLRGAFKEEEP